ncbi:PfkB family carbohydrate kinase [Ensifer aridi]|uniref:PfkB family carbohydrate kinase n=1 Tax=Ensifer aridi TaxID=1708715 RepID=UPI0006153E1D|nr:PfkB family carbohydrate kinase [Ensifer aridi]
MVKIVAMGDNVVDCYLARNEMYPGGNCLNVAVHASRFGAPSAYIGAIGRDKAGELILAALLSERVEVSRLRHIEGPTAYCLIGHRKADRVFLEFDLGVSMFTPSKQDLGYLANFDAVHIGQSSGLDAWVAAASRNSLISYDFSTRREPEYLSEIGRHCFLSSISGAGLPEMELNTLTTRLLAAGSRWVLVTRGRAGAALYGASCAYAHPARLVEAVDTLGAGDTFIARTLVGLLNGQAPQDVLGHAADAAADTCRYHGAIGYPAPIDIGPLTSTIMRRAQKAHGENLAHTPVAGSN